MVTDSRRRVSGSQTKTASNSAPPPWSVLSTRGNVLLYVALSPGATIKQVASNCQLSERATWGIVHDLQSAGMLRLHKKGRLHRYTVNLDAPFLHPTIKGISLRKVMGRLAERARHRRRQRGVSGHHAQAR